MANTGMRLFCVPAHECLYSIVIWPHSVHYLSFSLVISTPFIPIISATFHADKPLNLAHDDSLLITPKPCLTHAVVAVSEYRHHKSFAYPLLPSVPFIILFPYPC